MPYITPRHATQIRSRYGMTQAEFAWVLQLHPMTVSKWERQIQAIPARAQPWLQLLNRARPGRNQIEGQYGLTELAQQGSDAYMPPGWFLTSWWQRVMRYDVPEG